MLFPSLERREIWIGCYAKLSNPGILEPLNPGSPTLLEVILKLLLSAFPYHNCLAHVYLGKSGGLLIMTGARDGGIGERIMSKPASYIGRYSALADTAYILGSSTVFLLLFAVSRTLLLVRNIGLIADIPVSALLISYYAILQTLSNHIPYSLPDPMPVEKVMVNGAEEEHLTAMRCWKITPGTTMRWVKNKTEPIQLLLLNVL